MSFQNRYNSNNQLTVAMAKGVDITTASGVDLTSDIQTETYYDLLGRKIGTRDAESVRQGRTVFDSASNSNVNALQTSLTYDRLNRVVAERNAVDGITQQRYDNLGNHIQTVKGYGADLRTTSYSYDRNGRLLTTSLPLTTESYRFDALGNRIETSQWLSSDGVQRLVTRQAFDAFGRVIRTGRYDYLSYNASSISTGLRDFSALSTAPSDVRLSICTIFQGGF